LVIVIEKKARKLIHPIDRSWEVIRFCPHRLAANLYLGCEFGCAYCFARSISPDYHEVIIARVNAADRIDNELVKLKRRGIKQPVDLGSATDPYQPIEKKFEITRSVLKVFLKHRMPVFIVTKSDLVLRDLDLVKELRQRKLSLVHFSFVTLNEQLSRLLEVRSPPPEKRLRAIEELAEENIRVVARVQPVIPLVNDSEEVLGELLEALSCAGVQHVIYGTLKLSETVLFNLVPVLSKLGILDKFFRFYVIYGELDPAGYLVPSYHYRLKLAKFCAEKARKLGMTFGTCKEGFFELHTHRCSGLDLAGTYVPTIEHLLRYLYVNKEISLDDAVRLLKRLGADNWYIERFKKAFTEGIIFQGFPMVMWRNKKVMIMK